LKKCSGLIFILFFFSSCTRVQFVENGSKEFALSSVHGSEKIIETTGIQEFYFWGMIPEVATIDLDQAFKDENVSSPSMVKIERVHTAYSLLMTFLTLGLYVPSPYRIEVYSKGENRP
jgi:hypothetical protein